MEDPRPALRQILAFLEELAVHRPRTRESLAEDLVRQRFTLHPLALIGEAARRLPAAYKDAQPHVEWRVLIAFRNRLVHTYDAIDLDIVWHVLEDRLPPLRTAIARLADDEDARRGGR